MKVFYFNILLVLLPFGSHEQTSVTNSAGMGEEIPSPACLACIGTDWYKPGNISTPDDSLATTGLNPYGNCFMSTCFFSRFLFARNFNFKIPIDATIDSVFVDVLRAANIENSIRDTIVQLVKSGSPTGSNLASAVLWPKSLHYESYGHNDPLWGTTWSPVDLNDTTSGVTLKIENISSKEVEAGIDHIQMTVYYSTSTGIYSVTNSASSVEWINAPGEISANIFTKEPVYCLSTIYNLEGQKIDSAPYRQLLRGTNHLSYSTGKLPEGIYIWNIIIDGHQYARKFLIMK